MSVGAAMATSGMTNGIEVEGHTNAG